MGLVPDQGAAQEFAPVPFDFAAQAGEELVVDQVGQLTS